MFGYVLCEQNDAFLCQSILFGNRRLNGYR